MPVGSPYRVWLASSGPAATADLFEKYWWKFSSPESTVPQGVCPPEQLLRVPTILVPVGSALVLSHRDPAAGPVAVNTVVAVMRRLKAEPCT